MDANCHGNKTRRNGRRKAGPITAQALPAGAGSENRPVQPAIVNVFTDRATKADSGPSAKPVNKNPLPGEAVAVKDTTGDGAVTGDETDFSDAATGDDTSGDGAAASLLLRQLASLVPLPPQVSILVEPAADPSPAPLAPAAPYPQTAAETKPAKTVASQKALASADLPAPADAAPEKEAIPSRHGEDSPAADSGCSGQTGRRQSRAFEWHVRCSW